MSEFASASLTAGQLNAIVKKLGGHDMALRFLRDELSVSEPAHPWRDKDGVIYFNVTSDGMTGEDWITRLESKGFPVDPYDKSLLRSPDFKPTIGVRTEVAVFKGVLFEDNDRNEKKIRDKADWRKFSKPNAELACLIRDKFTDEEIKAMGLIWIVVMHERITNSDSLPNLLFERRWDAGRWFTAPYTVPAYVWNRDYGFAFTVSEGSSGS